MVVAISLVGLAVKLEIVIVENPWRNVETNQPGLTS